MTRATQGSALLKPRRVSYAFVMLALLLVLGLGCGLWYVYTAQQARPVAGQPSGTPKAQSSTGVGISTEKLAYDKPKPPPPVVVPVSQNGTAPDDSSYINGLVKRIGELEAQVHAKVTPLVTPAPPVASAPIPPKPPNPQHPPNPAIAAGRKALAESRKAPLVVIKTTVKPSDVMDAARTLQPGWKIPFLVESAIHSDIGGEFVARVSETVYASGDYRVPLIPAGATVLGSSQAAKLVPGNERLPLMGVTVSIPNLKPIELGSLPIMDQEGQLGMVDDIDHHYARMIGGIFVRGVVTGSTRVVQSESRSIGPAGEIGAGVAQGANQVANQQLQQVYDVRPTIKVMKGSRGYILVTKPLTIPHGGGIE